MSNEIEICNMALSYLGQDPILNLIDPKNTPEQLCALHYPIVRDSVIADRMWTFATMRAVSETNQKDEWGDQYAHDIPDGWLKVFRAYYNIQSQTKKIQSKWVVESGKILSDDPILYLWGVRQVVDVNEIPAQVQQAIAQMLAAELAIPITQNNSLMANMWALYETKLRAAAARDGGQGRAEIMDSTRLTDARAR